MSAFCFTLLPIGAIVDNRDCVATGSGLAGLSPQDRMKLKMQEKAKKNTAEKYTVEQLLGKVEHTHTHTHTHSRHTLSFSCFRLRSVWTVWSLRWRGGSVSEPDNLLTLDLLGHIHSELGDTERAKEISFMFLRAVQLSPDEGHSKYMSLGQIHTAQEAGAGAEAAAFPLQDSGSEILTARDMCVAYCSVAEIYFTDLCMEDRAGDQCRDAIERVLTYHPDNPEALQLMASYLFSTEKNQEGREYLMRSVDAWLPALKQSDAPPSREDIEEEHTQSGFPPYESRITMAKLLIEAEEYEVGIYVYVLEDLLEEDDEVVQVSHDVSFFFVCVFIYIYILHNTKHPHTNDSIQAHTNINIITPAQAHLLTPPSPAPLYVKLRCDDGPILEHMEQLLVELGDETEGEEETDPALDEDFELYSDDEEEDTMEH
uniref:Si:dkey-12j5.1 n=1 Tax=Oncorhynchus tshawytscha TaxID=74940 RepID=A0A8C8CQM3_ONCTS